MMHPSYGQVVSVQRRFPTRFAALDALLSTVTAVGMVVGREVIPMDSGLDAIRVFSDTGDDVFLIMRINADTFTITRKPRVA